MEKGRISKFDDQRGFGFITPDSGGEDLFVHKSNVRDMGYALEPSAVVEFERRPGKKPGKMEAANVVIKGFPEAAPPPVQSPSGRGGAERTQTASLPAECLFASFYDAQNHLDARLFYEAPTVAAATFRRAGLKSTQFRQLYQAFLAFAVPLRDHRMPFPAACERFGTFYCERVVRQVERKVLPAAVKNLIDAHRQLALGNERQMLALFRYLTNIYCYFGDSEKT